MMIRERYAVMGIPLMMESLVPVRMRRQRLTMGRRSIGPPISFARSARQRGSTLRRLCRAIVRSFLYMGRVRQAVQPAMNTVIGFGHSRRYQASAARI